MGAITGAWSHLAMGGARDGGPRFSPSPFLGGWSGSLAKARKKGDAFAEAIDIAPGVKLYQLIEYGLALQATIQGTKFWRDDELN